MHLLAGRNTWTLDNLADTVLIDKVETGAMIKTTWICHYTQAIAEDGSNLREKHNKAKLEQIAALRKQ